MHQTAVGRPRAIPALISTANLRQLELGIIHLLSRRAYEQVTEELSSAASKVI